MPQTAGTPEQHTNSHFAKNMKQCRLQSLIGGGSDQRL